MRVLCVLNPSAAGGAAGKRWCEVADLIERLGGQYELLTTEVGSSMAAQVSRHLESNDPARYDAIAGIGGDGTHSGIINGLMKFRNAHAERGLPPYAFIPMGTGNDVAKSLGIQIRDEYSVRDLRRAVSAIFHGADYSLDLGVIGGLYFADALTVGLDSSILRERNAKKRMIEKIPILRHLAQGRFLYTFSLGARLFRHDRVDAEIVVDGDVWYSGPLINLVINNTRIYAGDFDFSSNAYADDGLLEVVLFTDQPDYLARYLMAMRHNPSRLRELSEDLNRRARHVQGRHIRIKVGRAQPAQVDGEEYPERSEFDVGVVPRVLRIKTPAEPI
jgi:diacylglycerol kinase family enzyme